MSEENKQEDIRRLETTFAEMSKITSVTPKNAQTVIKMIQSASELLVYVKENDDQYFDLLSENMVLDNLQKFLDSKNDDVDIQILQTFSILIQNVLLPEHLYYILSHSSMNAVISSNYNFANDDVATCYVAFLKSIAIRLNSETIHLFYNERLSNFPLYTRATELFNYPNRVIRTEVNLITLTLYNSIVKQEKLVKVFSSLPLVLYFGKLACYARDIWLMMDAKSAGILHEKAGSPKNLKEYEVVSDLIDDSKNLLLYIEDVIKCIPELADVISNALLYFAVYPLVMARLVSNGKISYININTALMILYQITTTITYQPLLNAIAGALTFRNIPSEWAKAIEDFPEGVRNYSRNWKPFKCENDIEYILLNFNKNLGQFLDPTAPFLQRLATDYQNEKLKLELETTEKDIEKLNQVYYEKIIQQLGTKKEEVEKEHFRLSFALGVPVGLISILSTETPLSIMKVCKALFSERKFSMCPNSVCSNINKLILSKDDTVTLQICSLLCVLLKQPFPEELMASIIQSIAYEVGPPKVPEGSAVGETASNILLNALNRGQQFRFITTESLVSLIKLVIELTHCKINGVNESLYKASYGFFLSKTKEFFYSQKHLAELCDAFIDQWKFVEDFHKDRVKSTYKSLTDATVLLGVFEKKRTRMPGLLKIPSSAEESYIECFRNFLALRQVIPLVIPSENPESFPLEISTKKPTLTVPSIINGGHMGTECFEYKDQVLLSRILMESPEGIIIIEPSYGETGVTTKTLYSFKYTNLEASTNEKDVRKLVLKAENQKKLPIKIELVFEDAATANTMSKVIKGNKDKYTTVNMWKIESFLKACEFPEA